MFTRTYLDNLIIKESLTDKVFQFDEEVAKVVAKKWVHIFMNTKPCELKIIKNKINAIYKYLEQKPVSSFVYCTSPRDMLKRIKELYQNEGIAFNDKDFHDNVFYGNHESLWLGQYEALLESHSKEINPECVKFINEILDLARNANWIFFCENVCFISENPVKCIIDKDKYCNDKYCNIEYSDGCLIKRKLDELIPKAISKNPIT